MKYEQFPPVGSKTNRFLVYSPDDKETTFSYQHESGQLMPIEGAKPQDSFEGSKKIYTSLRKAIFDCCANYYAYRRNSHHGKRRAHALQLASEYRMTPVCVFEKGLNKEALDSFKTIFRKMRALCQGVRVSFSTGRQGPPYYYQISKPIMESVNRDLELVHKRTLQLNQDQIEDVPEIPMWSDTTQTNLYEGVYTANDWEILACAYIQEVETFLQAMLYLKYDFQPVEPEEEDDEFEGEDKPFVPEDLDEETLKILEDSMTTMRASVHFEDDVNSTPQPGNTSLLSETHLDVLEKEVKDSLREQASSQLTVSNFPTSELPRGVLDISKVSPEFKPLSPTQVTTVPSLPIASSMPMAAQSSPATRFDPLEPLGESQIVPDFQTEQINRVYGAQAPVTAPSTSGLDTEAYNEIFNKPHRYAQQPTVSQPSVPETPGVARAGYSHQTPGRSIYSLLASEPSYGTDKYAEGAKSGQNKSNLSQNYLQDLFGNTSGNNGSGNPPSGAGPPGPPGPPDDDDGNGPTGGNPFGPPGKPPVRPPEGGPPNGWHSSGPPGGGPPNPPGGGTTVPSDLPRNGAINIQTGANKWVSAKETHFDTKLKPDIIPTWDGSENTILRWITQLDELSQRSASVFKGMGDVVPTRFRDRASAWWFSLPADYRERVSSDWDSLKQEIKAYWMNQSWVEKAQLRALKAYYREPGHVRETPTEYYIRKLELLKFVYKFSPLQTMSEILLKAPRLWSTVLNPRTFSDLASFQTAIKYNEDLLIELGEKYDKDRSSRSSGYASRSYRVDSQPSNRFKNSSRPGKKDPKGKSVRTYAVGVVDPNRKPAFPRDDSNVSKGRTPEDYGARGCFFCGSTKHWDRDCNHHKGKSIPKARTLFVDSSPDELMAEAEYEQCYLDSLEFTDNEEREDSEDLINFQEEVEEMTPNMNEESDQTADF